MSTPRTVRRALLAATLATSLAPAISPASAQSLRIGVASEATSLDPHFYDLTPNMEVAKHLFSSLTRMSPSGELLPDLAASWTNIDPTTWEVILRPGAAFHDGTAVTAEDVVFSFERARSVPGSPSSFRWYLQDLSAVEVMDPLRLRLRTAAPAPLLMHSLRAVAILSRAASANATTADYDSGTAVIGTGPYRLVSRSRGSAIVLERNEGYFGEKPEWRSVTIRPIVNNGARTAALLAGDVDVINFVSGGDIDTLRERDNVRLSSAPGVRLYYLGLDVGRTVSPHVTDARGQPLPANPLQDVRVRRAMSLAIDRAGLAERLLHGQAVPTVYPALRPQPAVPPADLTAARRLLQEAGYAGGFELALAGPNNRYPFDAQVLQAVSQMWTRIGIRTRVDAMPSAVYFSRAARHEFSATFSGSLSSRGEVLTQLQRMLQTPDAQRGVGTGNWGRFSDPETDTLIETAAVTIDEVARNEWLHRLAERAITDRQAIIPLYFPVNTWGTRTGIAYRVRDDEYTLAADAVSQ
ncbi:ABC transporter substrate-binding protein [Muricoccus radiodurans]|uniref:ABC transporter substrate-binding protein n=1 Tax=Muricoccus radiodurans TaxID=2231721 RepID=UPI003CF0277A